MYVQWLWKACFEKLKSGIRDDNATWARRHGWSMSHVFLCVWEKKERRRWKPFSVGGIQQRRLEGGMMRLRRERNACVKALVWGETWQTPLCFCASVYVKRSCNESRQAWHGDGRLEKLLIYGSDQTNRQLWKWHAWMMSCVVCVLWCRLC